jgi:hypothetical protein
MDSKSAMPGSEAAERRILILGMTYPHYSKKYWENVCTGGVLDETWEMVRIHPVPQRRLDPDKQLHAFDWVRARVCKHDGDPRPESLRLVGTDDMVNDGQLADHDKRRVIMRSSPHLCASVEELHARERERKQSLGIVRPKSIDDVRVRMRPQSERQEWLEKEREVTAQGRLFSKPMKIDFPAARFEITFTCDDPTCKTHTMHMQQWGLHELFRKYEHHDPAIRDKKVTDAIWQRLDLDQKDVYLFLGNFRGTMYNFGLMDSYSSPRVTQTSMFG